MHLPTGRAERGFTLIELSIVLVIIGLIVGGVLVGRDLIKAAEVRATITQVDKFNTAASTFRGKYGALPGDLNAKVANAFGFSARGTSPGQGDGNGIVEGFEGNDVCAGCVADGEATMFWVDLTWANGLKVNLIDGSFSTATPAGQPTPATGPNIDLYLPAAKLGNGNHFYVWSAGPTSGCCPEVNNNGQNYFGLSSVTQFSGSYPFWSVASSPGLTVQQASAIDKKMDDGLPQSGNVTANYLDANTNPNTAAWAGAGTVGLGHAFYTNATPGSSTSCFDNGGVAGTQQTYSVEISNGANVNCALSFRFQ